MTNQRQERDKLAQSHAERRSTEHAERVGRFPTRLKGLWSRITGGHAKIKALNSEEVRVADTRDREEAQALVERPARTKQRNSAASIE